ncbi:MAG: TRAP transporter large permease [Sulfolobales archaeon]|nr:TRAP transporter large permease [Sulfolobales archaeon]MDW7969846.1 TRAP transporter large permease [Sulfolobales archaeon]
MLFDPAIIMSLFFMFFFIFVFLGIPITFSLGLSGLISLLLGGAKLSLAFKAIFMPYASFTMLAIYLFTFMGIVFQKTGLASLLIDALEPLVAKVKGGLAIVTVLASAFFGTLTGSANATAATFSRLIGPEMVRKGYPKPFVVSVIAASAPLGSFIPPSITGIVLSVATNTSVLTNFMAGAAIGFLVIGFLTLLILVIANRWMKGPSAISEGGYNRKEIAVRIIKAFPLLLMPLVVLGGIYFGVFSVTEGGAAGCLAALILATVYRKLNLKLLRDVLVDSAVTTGMVMLLVGVSYLMSYTMSLTGLNKSFIDMLRSMSTTTPYLALLTLVAILLAMGCFIDVIVLCIAMAPLAVTALMPLGINPYHINALFLAGNLIGNVTPPVGTVLFISLQSLGEKMENVFKALLPFLLIYVLIYLIITLFPETILWFPRLLGLPI